VFCIRGGEHMNWKHSISLLSVAFVASTALYSTAARADTNPIKVDQCFVTPPKIMSKTASGTQIDYRNVSSKVASNVTFAVGYRNAESNFLRRVMDSGDFEPGTPILHHFALYNDVTYAGKHVQACAAIKVKFKDGTVWTMNP
jgi:hypothetical protein